MNLTVVCIITLCVSAAIIVATVISAWLFHCRRKQAVCKTEGKSGKKEKTFKGAKYAFKPFHILLIGFFLAAAVIFVPIWYYEFSASENVALKWVKTVLLSIHSALRLFTLNGDFSDVSGFLSDIGIIVSSVGTLYSVYTAAISIVAPAMTAGFILSFFKETSAWLRYFVSRKSDIYVLSELNERSLALAQDIMSQKNSGRRTVVFTDVFDTTEETAYELAEKAKSIGAICMKKDVTKLGLKYMKKNIYRKIYLIGEDEDENIRQAISVINNCRNNARYNCDKTQIYVFSNSAESEVLLNTADFGKLKVRRVNWSRSLAIDTLRKYSMFESATAAKPNDKDGEKEINIVIVGLGLYGTEMLKGILWCGQMPGYRLKVHVFDKEENLEDKIAGFAPEIVKYNRKKIKGEAFYDIEIHGGVDVKGGRFQEEISNIKNVTMAFATLGDDDRNIETAVKMRMQFGRTGNDIPPIYAVVSNVFKTKTVKDGLKNFKGDDYGITFIGDTASRYSLEIIEQKELEQEAKEYHLAWVNKEDKENLRRKEEEYDKFEYFRRSSIAQAVYAEYREKCDLREGDGNDAETLKRNEILKEYEHRRWNVYMRTEGYVYGEERDDIAKVHPDLKPYQKLSEKERNKDSLKKETAQAKK